MFSGQCSRLKPSYEFHFEGLSNLSALVEGLVQIQDVKSKNIEMKYKTHIKLVHKFYGACFQYNVKNLLKNQEENNVTYLLILIWMYYRGGTFSKKSCLANKFLNIAIYVLFFYQYNGNVGG